MDLQFVPSDEQLVDIFSKQLSEERLILLRSQLEMIFINNWFKIHMLSTSAFKDMLSTCHYHTLTMFIIWMICHASFLIYEMWHFFSWNIVTLHVESVLGNEPNYYFWKSLNRYQSQGYKFDFIKHILF